MPPQDGIQRTSEKSMPRVEAHSGSAVSCRWCGPAQDDVHEHQRPEVHDRQLVAEDRPLGGLGQVVVHEAEVRGGQEEGHRVVAVPPLHEGVLDAGVGRVAAEQRVGDGHAVADVQDGHGDDRGDVEPDGDVEVLLAPDGEGAEEVDREDHPQRGDHDVEHPGQLSVLLPWVIPPTRASAAATISSCQPQKWTFDRASLHRRVFSSRCIEW